MRVLLDHCLDWRLARARLGHTVEAVAKLGWGHLKDKPLLEKAAGKFDVFVSSDKNLPYQQDLRKFDLAVAILDVPSNRLEDCLPKMPVLLQKLPYLAKGQATLI
jgi:hypothetical protein